MGGQSVRKSRAVFRGLGLNPGQGRSRPLRLDHTSGLGVDVEQIVSKPVPVLEGEFPQRDTSPSRQVGLVRVLDDPAGSLQIGVDLLAGGLLGRGHGIGNLASESTLTPADEPPGRSLPSVYRYRAGR